MSDLTAGRKPDAPKEIDVDAIIGANRKTCPSCDSNDKTVRWLVAKGFYIYACDDVWHDLPAGAAPQGDQK